MLSFNSFDWRRLTPLSQIEHRLTPNGVLLLRGSDPDSVPFTTAHVRDGEGGFVDRPIESLGFVWVRAEDGDGWGLRTIGSPITITHTFARWSFLASQSSAQLLVDERFILTTIACEVGDAGPDARGRVPAPRTEKGYPGRAGESDPGDGPRDAEDWAAFLAGGKRGIAHSSHGLMQTLISTAFAVRPDLFAGVDPSEFRDVLADPANSIACGTAFAATFPAAVRVDPLASRFQYGAGSVRPSGSNPWGAVLFDELVPMLFVAFWNDLQCVRTDDCAPAASFAPPTPSSNSGGAAAWIFAAFSLFALTLAASFATAMFARKRTA